MTNGEKLVKVFPDIELYKKMHGGIQIDFDSVWWNAEYKEPTTKNDLGVDAILRAEVNQVIEDYMDEQYDVLSDRTRERAFGARAVMARINELTSVTLQEPRWIPVSERLPEELWGVLVYCPTNDNIFCAYLEKDVWKIFSPEALEEIKEIVTAWMPLPKSYKAESEG